MFSISYFSNKNTHLKNKTRTVHGKIYMGQNYKNSIENGIFLWPQILYKKKTQF